jgi:hypothetical protein
MYPAHTIATITRGKDLLRRSIPSHSPCGGYTPTNTYSMTISYNALSALKRKEMQDLEDVVSSNNSNNEPSKSKARRVSTNGNNSVVSTTRTSIPSDQATGRVENAASFTIAALKSHMEIIGTLIQDLAHSDRATVNSALDVLNLDFMQDKTKRESLVTAGGCLALVYLMKNCLDKAIDRIPTCDQVTELWELSELAELTTLHKTLNVIIILTFQHDESRVGISAIGGVEQVVKIMQTFPKCQALQERACGALRNLACCSIGKRKVVETGGMEVLLAAVSKHLGSAILCQKGCWALYNIVNGSKENTGLLITLGGGATVAQVRTKWPYDEDVQYHVRRLASLIASEMKAWANDEYERRK